MIHKILGVFAPMGWAVMTSLVASGTAEGQQPSPDPLRDLLIEARGMNPEVQAARRTADAAAARIPQAGALPDPMLSMGLMYLPVSDFDFSQEGMTMGKAWSSYSDFPRQGRVGPARRSPASLIRWRSGKPTRPSWTFSRD